MRKTVYKFIDNIRKRSLTLNGILLIIYTALVLYSRSFTQKIISNGYPWAFYAISFLLCVLAAVILSSFSMWLLSRQSIETGESDVQRRTGFMTKTRDLALFGVIFAVYLAFYLSFYPGAFSPDSVSQYGQAVNNEYSDWHPVLHTLLAFKLPLLLTGGWSGSVVLTQLVWLSAVLAYAVKTLYIYAGKKYAVLSMLYVLLNPQILYSVLFPWKDIAFAICALLQTTFALRIYVTKGEWMKTPLNTAGFIIVTVVTTVVRHNAVLFTLPLLFAVMFFIGKKRFLIVCAGAAVLLFGIKVPLYSALGVEPSGNRKTEMLGLPMTVIGAAVAYDPDSLDEETLEFAYKVAPKETWQDQYVNGSYNEVKFYEGTDNDVIEEYGAPKVVSYCFRCFKETPLVSLSALVRLTESVYTLSAECGEFAPMYISPEAEQYGIRFYGISCIRGICTMYRYMVSDYFKYPFIRFGLLHYILLASVLAVLSLKKMKDWKRIFFILPLFIYNYGTMLLLTATDDAGRFFLYTFLVTPLLLVFVYKKE